MRMRSSWSAVVIAVVAACLGSSVSPSCVQARPSLGGQLFTNGSGWIPLATGGKGTFSVHGGIDRDGTPTGHLVYHDHAVDFRLASTSILAFTPGCLSTMTGTADSNRGPVEFVVMVLDSGEPGNFDTFTIQVVGPTIIPPYLAGGTLGGGNIQAHGLPCPP
jgi:hypothetical protein